MESPPNCAVALVPARLLLGGMGTNVAGIKPAAFPWDTPMESPPDCAVALVPYYPVRGPTFGDQAVAFPRETPSRNTGVAPELRRSTGALYRFILTLGGMGTNVAGITP